MITHEEAFAATNPADSDEERDLAAARLQLGSLANDIYWSSRSDVERLFAIANGHGVVTRTAGPATAAVAPHVDSTAVEEGEAVAKDAAISPPDTVNLAETSKLGADLTEGNETDSALSTLRAQLAKLGVVPEA